MKNTHALTLWRVLSAHTLKQEAMNTDELARETGIPGATVDEYLHKWEKSGKARVYGKDKKGFAWIAITAKKNPSQSNAGITEKEKKAIKKLVLDKYYSRNGRNVRFLGDGSVVVTIDGVEGTSRIYAGHFSDLMQEIKYFDNPSTAKKVEKKAAAWYGKESLVTPAATLKWTPPDGFVEIGTMKAVEYESKKFDGKQRIYRHDVTKKRKMFISLDGSTIVVHPPFRITKRGIEG